MASPPIASTSAAVPHPLTPFLSPDGTVSQQWFFYLYRLWERTGSGVGVSSTALQQEIANISVNSGVLNAMADETLPVSFPGLTVPDAMTETPAPPALVGMPDAWEDATPRPASPFPIFGLMEGDASRALPDPFMAALLVADTATDGRSGSALILKTTGLTADGALTTLPIGAVIQQIIVFNTTANAVTGGINIGTSALAADVVSALAVGTGALLAAPVLAAVFSTTLTQDLFISAGVSWNSADLTVWVLYNVLT